MRKKYMRTIMALICATIFMVQAVTTAYAAGCDCGCGKETCTHITDYKTEKIYYSTNGTSHRVEWDQICKCTECYVIKEKHIVTYEPCQWIDYTDLGHRGDYGHKYKLTCGICHGTYEITMDTCQGLRTGKHITPW